MQIPIINKSHHPLPSYQTSGSAGMDICAFLDGAIELKPLERKIINTGIYLEIPQGYEVQLRPRSGLALKNGITLLNSPATIDSDYRGEIKVLLINLSNEIQNINDGDRIAQMIVTPCIQIRWYESKVLSDTLRGEGGFGHTGKK
jgi:dUTP pyrophosphatase